MNLVDSLGSALQSRLEPVRETLSYSKGLDSLGHGRQEPTCPRLLLQLMVLRFHVKSQWLAYPRARERSSRVLGSCGMEAMDTMRTRRALRSQSGSAGPQEQAQLGRRKGRNRGGYEGRGMIVGAAMR